MKYNTIIAFRSGTVNRKIVSNVVQVVVKGDQSVIYPLDKLNIPLFQVLD